MRTKTINIFIVIINHINEGINLMSVSNSSAIWYLVFEYRNDVLRLIDYK